MGQLYTKTHFFCESVYLEDLTCLGNLVLVCEHPLLCSGVRMLEDALLSGEVRRYSASNQSGGPHSAKMSRAYPQREAPTGLALLIALPELDLGGGTLEAETWG